MVCHTMTTNILESFFFFFIQAVFSFLGHFYYSVVRFVCLFVFFFHCVIVVALFFLLYIYGSGNAFRSCREHCVDVCFSNSVVFDYHGFVLLKKTTQLFCTALCSFFSPVIAWYIYITVYVCVCT